MLVHGSNNGANSIVVGGSVSNSNISGNRNTINTEI